MTPHPQPISRAFTLVELLTAVAALALFLSIVAPAVVKAKEPVRRAMCADNLRHLMTGVLSYANDHAGKGPMRGWFSYTVAEPMYEVYGWGSKRTKVLANLGQLYKKWIGGQHDMLYCPSTYTTIRDMPPSGSGIGGGWETAFNPNYTYTYGSYNYAIPVAHRGDPNREPGKSPIFTGGNPLPPEIWSTGFNNWVQNTWQPNHPGQTFQLPNPPVLVTDWWVGGFTPVHRPGINVLYTDGHVRFHDIRGKLYGTV